ncbi:MAG TPA: Hsp70 family protein, partial [Actinomycetota bacterium]|nr:Hsp70 family protein [Actinomycetota bacterium]
KPSYGLTDGEIARMLQESFMHAGDDAQARALAETRVDAERTVTATKGALASDADLLDADERAAIDGALADVERLQGGDDRRALSAAAATLNAVTEVFASRRMNRGVARVLAGKRVDALE